MLKIALCDDSQIDRERVSKILKKIEWTWDEDFDITEFSSGKTLYENLKG